MPFNSLVIWTIWLFKFWLSVSLFEITSCNLDTSCMYSWICSLREVLSELCFSSSACRTWFSRVTVNRSSCNCRASLKCESMVCFSWLFSIFKYSLLIFRVFSSLLMVSS
ncbi:hypothetical protein BpHYR1_003135 [Brachionus plicatilis]|uniref:Uncharacterized protein n=1 Tax=Brachionus plicatilis TaxID=10195 RepID=A0A3M7QAU0_BRAPC|nr:hypothetical protein BpHYR1_003135 [Brachionus plicatilis]